VTEAIGRPPGLLPLLGTEAFERLAYFGMQALLALYLADLLSTPGGIEAIWLLPEIAARTGLKGPALAGVLLGINAALLQGGPLAGALLSDRHLGRDRALWLGGGALAAGHLLLALPTLLLPALAALIIGTGLFKGAFIARVNDLYASDDPHRDEGFRLLFIAISAGGLLAPVVIGTVGQRLGWHWGFALAGLCMAAAMLFYSRARRVLPAEHPAVVINAAGWRALSRPLLLALPTSLTIVTNFQLFNAYLPWAQAHANLAVAGRAFPASWLITVEAAAGIVALAASNWFWRRWQRHRLLPAAPIQMAAGSVLIAAAPLVLALAAAAQHAGGRIPLAWLLGFHMVHTLGGAQVMPLLMGESALRAPPGLVATGITASNALLFIGALLAGWLASMLPSLGAPLFWTVHAGLAAIGAILFLLLFRD
jgi:POT family proton-dependent oligopeptide transporter